MFLIAGLGNPGSRYAATRHNAGFMLLDRVAAEAGISFRLSGCALIGHGRLAAHRVVLAKPQTYMNRSGSCVKALVERFAVEPAGLLVVYDDAALPLGTLRFRAGGSSGGQKGMASVLDALETSAVSRLRIGVGDPTAAEADLTDFVLSSFRPREQAALEEVLEEASEGLKTFISEGIERAMARHNASRTRQEGEGG